MDDDHILLSELDWPCVCGHRHPEHTLEGSCRGCLGCTIDEDSDHAFTRCDCKGFAPSDVGARSHAIFPMTQ